MNHSTWNVSITINNLRWYSSVHKACIIMKEVQCLRNLEQTMLHFQQPHFLQQNIDNHSELLVGMWTAQEYKEHDSPTRSELIICHIKQQEEYRSIYLQIKISNKQEK